MSKKLKKIGLYIVYALGILAIIGLIIMPIGKSIYEKSSKTALGKLTDSRLIDYEAYSNGLTNLLLLYNIHDSESYNKANENCNISDALRSKFFKSDVYTGAERKAEDINILSVQYEISNDTTSRLYYVVLSRGTNCYAMLVELQGEKLVDYKVIGVI